MAIVAKGGVDLHKKSTLFNENVILVVDQDVGNLRVPEQRLKRTEAKDFVQQVGLDLFLFVEVQGNPLVGDDLFDNA